VYGEKESVLSFEVEVEQSAESKNLGVKSILFVDSQRE
jgi:hypothetical protein